MGIQIFACRPALERLPDTVSELYDIAEPTPDDAASPCQGALADLRTAAGRLADALAPALPGIAPAAVVVPALDAMQAADWALRAEYSRLRDGLTRPMLAEGDVLYASLRIIETVQEVMRDTSARYIGAIEVALEPALAAIGHAERLQDEYAQTGRQELVDVADEEIAAAEARARAIISDWRRPHTMPALRAVLARRNRSYLLD